jgi:hypothetical protein
LQDDFDKTREHLEGLKRTAQKITKGKPEEMEQMQAEIISEDMVSEDAQPKILPAMSSETPTDQKNSEHSSSNEV